MPVKKLMNDHTVVAPPTDDGIAYFHILFDQHEVLNCDGLEAESYFLGDHALFAVDTHAELCSIFPELGKDMATLPAAHMVVADKKAELLLN